MLGSDLVRYLQTNYKVIPICKENYQTHIGKSFDILVNANGNSKRFWANKNPQDDFLASTVSVYKSIFDFPSDIYIYISSPDVYEDYTSVKSTNEAQEINAENLSLYGFHKYLSELIVKKHKKKYFVLRCSMILGTSLKKGPLYDVIHKSPLHITLGSKLQFTTTRAISEIIKTLLENSLANETLNVGGTDTFAFTKIRRFFDHEIQILPEAETQVYQMNVEKLRNLYSSLKTSEEYLQEFLKSYRNL